MAVNEQPQNQNFDNADNDFFTPESLDELVKKFNIKPFSYEAFSDFDELDFDGFFEFIYKERTERRLL